MSPTLRRLMREAAELSAASSSPPSPHFCAHPVSDSNLFDWHFTLAGPPAPSPYAGGIYHGRIVLPPQYPLRPPSFRFLTPSGRFEVNREICLSISGHHEETWQPAWGIRTALLAIRSFMDAEVKGQVGGLEAREEVRRELAQKSRAWRCEVCEKTNAQILEEWREVCRAKGVAVDDEEESHQAVPEELKIGYKDEMGTGTGKQKDMSDDRHASEQQQSVETRNTAEPSTSTSSDDIMSSASSAVTQEPSIRDADSAPQASTPAAVSSSSSSSTSVPPPTSISISPSTTTSGTTTTTTATRTTTAQQRTVPHAVQQSSDTLWLDRAIVGVVIALVCMILRKILKAEYIYDI